MAANFRADTGGCPVPWPFPDLDRPEMLGGYLGEAPVVAETRKTIDGDREPTILQVGTGVEDPPPPFKPPPFFFAKIALLNL